MKYGPTGGNWVPRSGWVLSPAFDLNPDPSGTGLSLNISETDNALNFDLALEVSPFFRLKPADAESILQQVKQAVKSWQSHAKTLGIARVEQEIMATAFEVCWHPGKNRLQVDGSVDHWR